MNSIWLALVAFAATPTGHDALTGLWVAFSADLFLWLKETTNWIPPGFVWQVALKRYVSGFVLGALKGAGLG